MTDAWSIRSLGAIDPPFPFPQGESALLRARTPLARPSSRLRATSLSLQQRADYARCVAGRFRSGTAARRPPLRDRQSTLHMKLCALTYSFWSCRSTIRHSE